MVGHLRTTDAILGETLICSSALSWRGRGQHIRKLNANGQAEAPVTGVHGHERMNLHSLVHLNKQIKDGMNMK